MSSKARRAGFLLGTLVLVVGAIELGSKALLYPAREEFESRLRAAVMGGGAMPQGIARQSLLGETIHPYLGIVGRPSPEHLGREVSLETLGFPGGGPLVRERDPDTVVAAIFGGSVAWDFAAAGGLEQVFAALASDPRFAGRRLVALNAAHGAWKQPQPLIALSFLLSLGLQLDVAILLDGYNDIVLGPAEGATLGTSLLYPSLWAPLVADLDVESDLRARIGELSYLARRRREAAEYFDRSWLRGSSTAALLWLVWDRRLEAEMVARRFEVRSGRVKVRSDYTATGPTWPDAGAEPRAELAALWKRSAETMHSLCEGSGILFYHFLQPNQYVDGSKPMTAEERSVAIREEHPYAPHAKTGYPLLREAGRELQSAGIAFHDLTQIFASTTEPVYIDDCCHVGPLGNSLLADAIARAIRQDGEGAEP